MKMIIAFITYMVVLMACAAGAWFFEGALRFSCIVIFSLLGGLGAFLYNTLRKADIG